MDPHSHWAPTDVGAAGFQQVGAAAVPGGTAAPSATVASHQGASSSSPPPQGWALASKQAPQQAQGGEAWGTSTSSMRSPNQNAGGSSPLLLDEAINQFGGMTLGAGPAKSGFGAGAIVECQHAVGPGGGGGVDGLSMGSLRLAEEAGGAGGCFGHHPVRSQSHFGSFILIDFPSIFFVFESFLFFEMCFLLLVLYIQQYSYTRYW